MLFVGAAPLTVVVFEALAGFDCWIRALLYCGKALIGGGVMCLFWRREPKTTKAKYRAGVQALQKEEYEKALGLLGEVLEVEPDHVGAIHNLGYAYHLTGEHSKAIEQFERVIELKPDEARAYLNVAAAYNALGHLDSAEDALHKVLAITPQQAGAHYNLAIIQMKRQRFASAMAEFELELAINPRHKPTLKAIEALRKHVMPG